jgi:Zn-finger protein
MSNELAVNDDTSTDKHLVDMATEWSEHNGSTQAAKSKNDSINYENNYIFFPTQYKSKTCIVIYCTQKPTDEDSSHNGQAYNSRTIKKIIQCTPLNSG